MDVPRDLSVDARSEARRGGGWYEALARAGLVAKGLSFGLVGALALKLALGDGGSATSREGALAQLARHSFGAIVLAALCAGFAAYALWRLVEAFALQEESAAKRWGKRAFSLGRAAIYGGLAVSSFRLLVGTRGSQSQDKRAHHTAATVLSWPGGTWIVGIAGVAIVGVAFGQVYRAFSRSFEERWRTIGATPRRWGGRLGVAGHLARAVVFGLIGVFVVKAALDYSPKDAIGLDGALQKLAHASYGPWLLGVTASGLVCYALYCLFDARYRDVSA